MKEQFEFNGFFYEWSLRAFASMTSTAIFWRAKAGIKNLLCELANNNKQASTHLNFASKSSKGKILRAVKNLMDHSSPLLLNKKDVERISSRPEFPFKFADWFSSVFQSLQMHCRVFYNLANSSSVKTNQKIMIFTGKKHTFRYSGLDILEKTKETKVI